MSEYVYFVQRQNGNVKIGTTTNPRRRIPDLSGAIHEPLAILKIVGGGAALEKQLHAQFKHLRAHHEWFLPGQELLDFIATLDAVEIVEREARKPDCYTVKATENLRMIIEQLYLIGPQNLEYAHQRAAEICGIRRGTVERLLKGRVIAITMADFIAIQDGWGDVIRLALESLIANPLAQGNLKVAAHYDAAIKSLDAYSRRRSGDE